MGLTVNIHNLNTIMTSGKFIDRLIYFAVSELKTIMPNLLSIHTTFKKNWIALPHSTSLCPSPTVFGSLVTCHLVMFTLQILKSNIFKYKLYALKTCTFYGILLYGFNFVLYDGLHLT